MMSRFNMYVFLSVILTLSANCQDLISISSKQIDSLTFVSARPLNKVKPSGKAYIIKVNNQQQFDNLNDELTGAIQAGHKNIKVKINKGIYFFHENHIQRKNEQLNDVFISIDGKKAIVTSDASYNTPGYPQDPWMEVLIADSLIEVVDTLLGLCFIPYKNSLASRKHPDIKKVKIAQWYQSVVYDVSRITDDGIFFIAPSLQYNTSFRHKGYTINYDYLYLGSLPRFSLYDCGNEPDCKASKFINLLNCSYKGFSVKGLSFDGNMGEGSLIALSDVRADQVLFSNCSFVNIRNNVVYCNHTANVIINGNVVRNTEKDGLVFSNNCANVRVTNNLFENIGQSLNHTFCVSCAEAEYYIANNIFRNFSYAAIGVGVWYGFSNKSYSGGIIEHNEIYYTANYYLNKDKHTLMDSGAIYVFTQNDGVILRYNYIHDYTGAGDNRGIFCDDGANNLKIYGNVILNTPNSYSIDSRYSKDKNVDNKNNSNNFMANNIVDNRVRFMGYVDEERHTMKGSNIILGGNEIPNRKNKYENLEVMEDDITLTGSYYKNRTLTIPRVEKRAVLVVVQDSYIRNIVKKAKN